MDPVPICHVVALPYPGRGHINPMMNICKLLASEQEGLIITFVVTEEWFGFIGSARTPPNMRLRSIPNVIPSELGRGADFAGFIKAVYTKMEAPVERLLEGLEPKVSCILADTYLPWAVSVGKRRNIAVASLWTMSPLTFSIFHHFNLLRHNGHSLLGDLPERGDERVYYIPGIPSIRLADLPKITGTKVEEILRRALEAFSWVTKAHCLLFTSSYEIENHVIDSLRQELPIPIYPVGPSIPYMTLLDMPPKAMDHNHMDYYGWLDSQLKRSVLYVSLGSFLPVSGPQMDEIAIGLCVSGVHFLWVARGDVSHLQEMCGEMGLVVPWCDQLRVLCHSSVGGFLTHCGWNSTMEGLFAGVPMLTFPLFWDQFPNAKLIVEDWKVGLRIKEEVGEENVVQSTEIAVTVKKLMELDGDESKELRRRASEMKETCTRAIEKGGSSDTNLRTFVKEIVRGHKD